MRGRKEAFVVNLKMGHLLFKQGGLIGWCRRKQRKTVIQRGCGRGRRGGGRGTRGEVFRGFWESCCIR